MYRVPLLDSIADGECFVSTLMLQFRHLKRFKTHQNTSKNYIRSSFAHGSLIVGGSEVRLILFPLHFPLASASCLLNPSSPFHPLYLRVRRMASSTFGTRPNPSLSRRSKATPKDPSTRSCGTTLRVCWQVVERIGRSGRGAGRRGVRRRKMMGETGRRDDR
jgi:hypothetical protein